MQGEAGKLGHLEHAGFVHPSHQGLVCLGRQIDEHTAAGLLDRRLDDAIERLIAVDQHRGCIVGIKAKQSAVRAIGVKTNEGQLMIDQELGDQPGDHGFADPALFATNEVHF